MTASDYQINIGGDVHGQVAAGERVRQEQASAARPGADRRIVVLFLAANPLDTERLRLDEEVRTIEQRLREGDSGRRLDLRQQWAVRPTDLSTALLEHRPVIVHFSGHGTNAGRLVLQDEQGRSFEPPADAIADLFAAAGRSVRCVVLNACHSLTLAGALAAHVECVVGTTAAIEDIVAYHFAAGFYRAIGFGESIQTAFDLGRNEIDLVRAGSSDVAVLLTRPGIDAGRIHPLPPP